MGRFHRHDDATGHGHGHGHDHDHDHDHDHGVGDHSGYATGGERIEVLERIFDENDRTAAANRADFDTHGVFTVNLMSSPGAGKTTLLRAALERLHRRIRVGIVEGDIETGLDADRLAGFGAQISLLNTANGFGGECHLDAPMVRSALSRLDLAAIDLLIVENVGNLVCPAEFRIGEDARVMVCSVTEGEDKPLKYPLMFRACELVVVNKIDLLAHLELELERLLDNVAAVNPGARTLLTSAVTGEGVDELRDWMAALPARERATA